MTKEEYMSKAKKCWVLFITMLTISSTANSGYAILSVVISTFVKKHQWISEKEMEDYIALIQGSPGPLAINISYAVGYQIAGIFGALSAVLGCAIPPLAIMLVVSVFYGVIVGNEWVRVFMHGMQAGVIAMLTDMIIGFVKSVTQKRKVYPVSMIIAAFLFAFLVKGSTLPLVISFLLIGCAAYFIKAKREESGK